MRQRCWHACSKIPGLGIKRLLYRQRDTSADFDALFGLQPGELGRRSSFLAAHATLKALLLGEYRS